jgi:hypothetical protein
VLTSVNDVPGRSRLLARVPIETSTRTFRKAIWEETKAEDLVYYDRHGGILQNGITIQREVLRNPELSGRCIG